MRHTQPYGFTRTTRFTPTRTPRVSIAAVPCPDCPAEVGDRCYASTGGILPSGHASRRRMAVRHHNALTAADTGA